MYRNDYDSRVREWQRQAKAGAALLGALALAICSESIADVLIPDHLAVEEPAIIAESQRKASGFGSAAELYVVESANRVNPSPLADSEWETLLEVCEERHIAPYLALGLVQVESGFRVGAVSPEGCYGYCQLNPRHFPTGLIPEENIRAGLTYLGDLLDRYDDLGAALTAYNAGHDTGSRTYANKVLAAADEWYYQGFGL